MEWWLQYLNTVILVLHTALLAAELHYWAQALCCLAWLLSQHLPGVMKLLSMKKDQIGPESSVRDKFKEQEWRWWLGLEARQGEKRTSSFQPMTISSAKCSHFKNIEKSQQTQNPKMKMEIMVLGKWNAHYSLSLLQSTDICQSKTSKQENTPRKDIALPRNNNIMYSS